MLSTVGYRATIPSISPRMFSGERNRTKRPSESLAIAWAEQYVHRNGQPRPSRTEGYRSSWEIQGSHIVRSTYGSASRSWSNGDGGFFSIEPSGFLSHRW